MNWKVAGMAGTAFLTVALSGAGAFAGANKFTGNISLAVGQTFESDDFFTSDDDSFASISGEANVNVAFTNNINLQLNMAGASNFVDATSDRKTGFQGAAHVYTRNDTYAVGLFGGVGTSSPEDFESAEYYFIGAEGQYYCNNLTVGLNAGYLDSDSGAVGFADDIFLNGAWFTNAEVRWYATAKTTVTGNVGYISGETAHGLFDQKTIHWGAKAEYWPEEKEPLSLWVAYEGRSTDFDRNVAGPSFSKDEHTIKIGVTFHFGVEGGTKDQDRSGPAFNTMDYGAVVVGG